MEETKYQGELFELDKPKVSQRKLDTVFPKTRFAVTLSLERIVFISIGVIMLMVALYALGVEKGKSSNRVVSPLQRIRDVKRAQVAVVAPSTPPIASQTRSAVPAPEVKTNIQAKNAAMPSQSQPVVSQPAERPYTIVAAAFSRQESAASEVARMKADRSDAFVLQSGSYYLVCVGSYTTKESAQKMLTSLRLRYKDAYIKTR